MSTVQSTTRPASLSTFWSDIQTSATRAIDTTLAGGARAVPIWFADQLGLQRKDQLAAPTRGANAFRGSQTNERNTLDPSGRPSGFATSVRGLDGVTLALVAGVAIVGLILVVRR